MNYFPMVWKAEARYSLEDAELVEKSLYNLSVSDSQIS